MTGNLPMPSRAREAKVASMPTLLTSEALRRLADDVVASAWLLPDGDPVRAYLSMLGALPAEEDAWLEVLAPWLEEMRRGLGPELTDPLQVAAIAAVGVSALRAARDLPPDAPIARALHHTARWCFYLVRPDAR